MVDELRAQGASARGVDLRPSPWTDLVGDVRDANLCARAVAGVDAVVHCAARVSVQGSIDAPDVDAEHNVLATVRLLQAAADARVKRFVFISSAAVYGVPLATPVTEEHPLVPLSPYGAAKVAGEHYVRAMTRLHAMQHVIARPFNIYSARQDPTSPYSGVIAKFADALARGEAPRIYGDGSATRDFVHATDVARWLATVARPQHAASADATFNLGTSSETSVADLAAKMLRLADREDLAPRHEPPRAGEIPRSVADVTRARAAGFAPRVALEAGLEEVLQAARAPPEKP